MATATPILDTAVAWWHADRYDPSTDTSWPDQSGNGHHAQLGSTSGSDTNDPRFLPYDGEQYMWRSTVGPTASETSACRLASNAAVDAITGSVAMECDLQLDLWDTTPNGWMIMKYDGSRIYAGFSLAAGLPRIWMYDSAFANTCEFRANVIGGLNTLAGVSDGDRLVLRATINVSTKLANFYYKNVTNGETSFTLFKANVTENNGYDPPGGFSWDLGGSAAGVSVSDRGNDGGSMIQGKFFRATIYDALPPTADDRVIEIDFADATPGAATFLEAIQGYTVNLYRGSVVEPLIVNRDMWHLTGDDYFNVADHADLDVGTADDFTAYVVFRTVKTGGSAQVLLAKRGYEHTSQAGYDIVTAFADQKVFGRISDGGGQSGGSHPTIIAPGEHGGGFALDRQTDITPFADGSPTTGITDNETNSLANALALRFGVYGTSVNWYKGAIVGVALFRSLLSDAQVAALHAELVADLTPDAAPAAGGYLPQDYVMHISRMRIGHTR